MPTPTPPPPAPAPTPPLPLPLPLPIPSRSPSRSDPPPAHRPAPAPPRPPTPRPLQPAPLSASTSCPSPVFFLASLGDVAFATVRPQDAYKSHPADDRHQNSLASVPQPPQWGEPENYARRHCRALSSTQRPRHLTSGGPSTSSPSTTNKSQNMGARIVPRGGKRSGRDSAGRRSRIGSVIGSCPTLRNSASFYLLPIFAPSEKWSEGQPTLLGTNPRPAVL
ncbi:hypothetical protein DFH08DRAFT_806316 [Mycena albidolilacea]|uniref:Uncharacterized protein n=1 Tax=Mycena albidolilacea TaxID=1033008 RepID=A0AAD7A8V0_9AGAR|nr:hypothetical protein DFH08DRAFT_806316 [Mycena albidolilacea]